MLYAEIAIFFFLSPRSIKITNSSTHIKPYNITYIQAHNGTSAIIGIILDFEESFSIENPNFYTVYMRNVSLQLNRNSRILLPKLSYTKGLPIERRGNDTFQLKVKYTLSILNDPYVQLCINNIIDDLFTLVSSAFSFSTLWSNDETYMTESMQYLFCTNNSALRN